MTNRLIMFLLCAVLALAPIGASCAEVHNANGVYTIEYDDGMTLDTTTHLYDRTDSYTWLFMLYDGDCTIDASMTKVDYYKGMSLFSATEKQRSKYLEETMDVLADFQAEHLGIVDKDGIPFYIYSCINDEGAYLLAETIANGYSLDFYCYYNDETLPVDEALAGKFTKLLMSFEPVR